MFQKIAKHRANDASNDVHRPPLCPWRALCEQGTGWQAQGGSRWHKVGATKPWEQRSRRMGLWRQEALRDLDSNEALSF